MSQEPNKLPDDINEIVDRISSRLSYKFKFGYHTIDDMKQQAALFAWEGIQSWDEVRPIENFLWIHVRNRLYNFKRNNYGRPEKPCDSCPLYVNKECTKYNDMMDCHLYSGWSNRNESKKSLMSTYSTISDNYHQVNEAEELFSKEVLAVIDLQLHVSFREDWIRFSNNLRLPKQKRERLLLEIVTVLKENGIVPEEEG